MRWIPGLFLAAMALACQDGIRAQSFAPALWIRDATLAAHNFGLDVADDGSVYMAGRAGDGSRWSDGTVFEPGYNRNFITRHDADGNLLWIRSGATFPSSYGGTWDDTYIYDVVAREGLVLTNVGVKHWNALPTSTWWSHFGGVVLCAYSDAGDSLDTMYLTGEPPGESDYAPGLIEGLAGDAAGNFYLAGYFKDSLRLGPETLLVPPPADHPYRHVFLASYTPDGEVRWVRRMAGREDNSIAWWSVPQPSFEVDAAGNAYLGGYFTEGTVFGEGQPHSVRFEERTAAVVAYRTDGSFRWVRTAKELGVEADPRFWGDVPGTVSLPAPWKVAANEAGELGLLWRLSSDIGFSGGFGGRVEVTVGDTTYTETEPRKDIMFVTRHAPDGRLQWVRRLVFEGLSSATVTDLVMDREGHVYIGGAYFGTHLQLENTVLLSGKDMDSGYPTGFAAHYSTDGQLLETLNVTGPEATTTSVMRLVPTSAGELYVAGHAINFRDDPPIVLAVGRDTLRTNTSRRGKLFLAKYRPVSTTREPDYVRIAGNLQVSHYPNPFLGAATITYELPEASHVILRVYDMLGRELAVLVDKHQVAGPHSAQLDAAGWPSGVYLYRLEAGNQVATGRLVRRK